jgi:hypothetical protein
MSIKLPVYHVLDDHRGFYVALLDGNYDVCRDHRHATREDAEQEMRQWEHDDREAKKTLEGG